MSRVRVVARIRPLLATEPKDDALITEGSAISLRDTRNPTQRVVYKDFAACYDHSTPKTGPAKDIFEEEVAPLLENVYRRDKAVTVICYGVTNSGKTTTLMGNENSQGIIKCTVEDLLRRHPPYNNGEAQYRYEIQYLEVYCNDCYDLLNIQKTPVKLAVKEQGGRVDLPGLSSRQFSSLTQFEALLRAGGNSRKTASTSLNRLSSRSHAIVRVKVFQLPPRRRSITHAPAALGRIEFVDLAGSERISSPSNNGMRPGPKTHVESVAINQSLTILSRVVNALEKGDKYVPYREHCLTRVLKDSLGEAATLLICNISPAAKLAEIRATIEFATKAKGIRQEVPAPVLEKHAPRISQFKDFIEAEVTRRVASLVGTSEATRPTSVERLEPDAVPSAEDPSPETPQMTWTEEAKRIRIPLMEGASIPNDDLEQRIDSNGATESPVMMETAPGMPQPHAPLTEETRSSDGPLTPESGTKDVGDELVEPKSLPEALSGNAAEEYQRNPELEKSPFEGHHAVEELSPFDDAQDGWDEPFISPTELEAWDGLLESGADPAPAIKPTAPTAVPKSTQRPRRPSQENPVIIRWDTDNAVPPAPSSKSQKLSQEEKTMRYRWKVTKKLDRKYRRYCRGTKEEDHRKFARACVAAGKTALDKRDDLEFAISMFEKAVSWYQGSERLLEETARLKRRLREEEEREAGKQRAKPVPRKPLPSRLASAPPPSPLVSARTGNAGDRRKGKGRVLFEFDVEEQVQIIEEEDPQEAQARTTKKSKGKSKENQAAVLVEEETRPAATKKKRRNPRGKERATMLAAASAFEEPEVEEVVEDPEDSDDEVEVSLQILEEESEEDRDYVPSPSPAPPRQPAKVSKRAGKKRKYMEESEDEEEWFRRTRDKYFLPSTGGPPKRKRIIL